MCWRIAKVASGTARTRVEFHKFPGAGERPGLYRLITIVYITRVPMLSVEFVRLIASMAGRHRKRDDAHARELGSMASPEPSHRKARGAAVHQGRPCNSFRGSCHGIYCGRDRAWRDSATGAINSLTCDGLFPTVSH